MDITTTAPLNNRLDETHLTWRVWADTVRLLRWCECGIERWKSARSSCERRTWLPMSSALSGTLSSGNMEAWSSWERQLRNREEITLHGCDICISWARQCRIDWSTTNSHYNFNSLLTSDIIPGVTQGILNNLMSLCPMKKSNNVRN